VGDLASLAGSVTYWCMGCKRDVDRIVTIRPGAYRKPPKLLCEECAKGWLERNKNPYAENYRPPSKVIKTDHERLAPYADWKPDE
jgi:hypothetical protein